jgi:prepilin-type N-terminal cleavage/methylation domain-containing protein
MKTGTLKENKGVSLIELLIVLVIVGIIAGFGLPEYGRFLAKSRVRRAATELMQNMRLTRTMAIKENRTYLITLDPATNTYRIGFDTNGNSSLADAGIDVYGQGAVRVTNVQNEYGVNVVLGESNFVLNPPNGPNGATISTQSSFSFMADSSSSPNGMIYFQDNNRAYTFCIELANTSGKTNLFMWQGDENNTGVTAWTELR